MTSIETRLEHIELQLQLIKQKHRRERCVGLICATLLGAAALVGFTRAPEPQVIQASRLEILDANGKITCLLSNSPTGGQLDVWGSGGSNVARLSSSESGGDLTVWNSAGKPVAGLFANSTGGRLEVTRGNGQLAGFLEATKDGSDFVLTHSDSEDNALQLSVNAERTVGTVQNSTGKPAVRFGSSENGAAFSVLDSAEKEVAYLGCDSKNAGMFRIAGANGKTAVECGVNNAGGEFRIADINGTTAVECTVRDGGGELAVRETNGAGGCILGNTAMRGGYSEIRNHDGKAALSFEVQENFGGRATVRTATGQIAALMDQGKEESGTVQIFAGATRMAALSGGPTGGLLNLFNMKGKAVVVAGVAVDADGGLLSLRNSDGQQTVRAAAQPNGEVASYSNDGTRKRILSSP